MRIKPGKYPLLHTDPTAAAATSHYLGLTVESSGSYTVAQSLREIKWNHKSPFSLFCCVQCSGRGASLRYKITWSDSYSHYVTTTTITGKSSCCLLDSTPMIEALSSPDHVQMRHQWDDYTFVVLEYLKTFGWLSCPMYYNTQY